MENSCCEVKKTGNGGLWQGIIYGLLPHAFCIGFIVFSVAGSALAAGFFKKFLLIPYFFQFLVGLSVIMATISAIFYLKKNQCLCADGIKKKWKYLTILYGVTIIVNLLMFSYVMPALANINSVNVVSANSLANLSLAVQIPCSGHAPLITDELKKDAGVKSVNFKNPNIFNIQYDPGQTSPEKIEAMDIFKTYRAVENIIN